MANTDMANILTDARVITESFMTDRVRITTVTMQPNEANWGALEETETLIYDGPGLMQQASYQQQGQQLVAGQVVQVGDYICKIPISVDLPTDLGKNARITVASSLDPANTGVYTLVAAESNTWAVCRRILAHRHSLDNQGAAT